MKFTLEFSRIRVGQEIPSFSSVQSLSRVWLFATPWIAAHQASLSITISQNSLKLTSIESVMPSSHLILCRPPAPKTLESPLDCKNIQPVHPKGDQSWVFIEGLMSKLKLQYFGHLMWRVDSLEKTLLLGGIGGRRRRGQQRMRWLDGITNSMDVSLSDLQ